MKELKEKGITLVALVVTIIILLILAGVAIGQIAGNNGLFKRTREAVEKYKDAQEEEQNQIEKLDSMLNNMNKTDEVYDDGKVKVNIPKLEDGMIPIKYDEAKQNWVITNENDEEWYDYSEGKMLWANVMLSDGKYKESNKEYTEDGTTEVKEEDLGSMFVWVPRYAYSFNSYHTEMNSGEGTTQNITKVVFLEGTSNKDFNGKEYVTTYDPVEAEVGKPTPTVVHPGFTFDNKQLTGIWVAKFEASMSGTKTNTTDDNNIETKNTASEKCVKVLPNAETWRYISIGNSFFNCLNMNGENNIYGITSTQLDSHLMKNIEWGAASYLAVSQYGNTPTINSSGQREGSTGDVYHEYAGGKDYITNVSQSTTGNATGIYDMCGGNWERVAAYYDNLDQNLLVYGLKSFKETEGKGIELVETYTKYWDKYEVGTEEKNVTKVNNVWRNTSIWKNDGSAEANQKRIDITKEKYELMSQKEDGTSRIGDGLYEVIKDYSYYGVFKNNSTWNWIQKSNTTAEAASWGLGYYNGDFTLIGNCAQPFVRRGGNWGDGTRAGVFALTDYNGYPYYNYGFRPVVVV